MLMEVLLLVAVAVLFAALWLSKLTR